MAIRIHAVQVTFLSLLVVGTALTTRAADRFVSPAGSDAANDCLNSAAPCRTPQHALGQSTNGDTVELAKGSYAGPLAIASPPSLTVTIQGGWSRDFTTRDVVRNKTSLKGVAGSYAVEVTAGSGGAVDATLDGVTILGAKNGAIDSVSTDDGVLTLTVASCTLKSNRAYAGAGIGATAADTTSGSLFVDVDDSTL